MEYSEPKVTIDLKEYEELIRKNGTSEDDKLVMLRHFTYLLITNLQFSGSGINILQDAIREMKGLSIEVSLGNSTRLQPDDISFTRIKK